MQPVKSSVAVSPPRRTLFLSLRDYYLARVVYKKDARGESREEQRCRESGYLADTKDLYNFQRRADQKIRRDCGGTSSTLGDSSTGLL